MKNIVILGSTGSIGKSAIKVIEARPDRFKVVGLTANSNAELLLEQIAKFKPQMVAVADPQVAAKVRLATAIPVLEGTEGLIELAVMDGADFVLSAIVGAAGLEPTMAAVSAGRTIGLANKETLVVAGDMFMQEAKRSGARILPVDSEHSAVYQCLHGYNMDTIRRIVLTASGGPFFGRTRDELAVMTPQQALKHPSWSMGRKISIDSATLMNKGLEVIEAHYLFGVEPENIDVVVHPQSIVHSMVEFRDRGMLAQLSVPDMKGAIAYAMSYPDRVDGVMDDLDLASAGELTFARPDMDSFPCLALAYEALRAGGLKPAVLNAANEAAVEAFLEGRIGFMEIPEIIGYTMDSAPSEVPGTLKGLVDAHDNAINEAKNLIETRALK